MREAVLCQSLRTPVGKFGGSLKDTPAVALGAATVEGILQRTGLNPAIMDGVLFGHVIQAGAGMNTARQAALNGGLDETVPAATVNRVCGSGAEAIAAAARLVRLGEADCVIAGGMENMDQGPYLLDQARWGYRMGPGTAADATLRDGLNDAFSGRHSGWHTEDLVAKYEVSRRAQDEWAARSQQSFSKAEAAGLFRSEIIPVTISAKKGTCDFKSDEAHRPDTTHKSLAKLKPAFRENGTITAGNAPGLNSAAAAMIVASQEFANKNDLQVQARVAATGTGAVAPGMFGLGPVPAVHQALNRAGWKMEDIQRAEINEAFAAIAIVLSRELGLSEEIVNVEGGAIAHGHPIGATGAILATRLMHSMARDGLQRGLVTLCIGGGQGIALLLERQN